MSMKEFWEEYEELHKIKKAYSKTDLPAKHHYIFGRVVSYANFKEVTNKAKNSKQVMIKLVGNMGVKRLVNAISYAIENSELTYAINERGEKLSLNEIYEDWSKTFSSRENSKEAWHLVFSLDEKILTPKQQKAFMDSVRETMDINFFGHKYAMVLHTHQSRPHLHIILNKYNFIEHKRLHFKQKGEIKNFFKNLRDDFAYNLGARGLNYINKNPLEKNLEEELAKTNKMDRIIKSDSQFGISMIYEDLQKTLDEKIRNKEKRIKELRREYEELKNNFDDLQKLLQQYINHKNKKRFSLYKKIKELGKERRAISQKILKEMKEKQRLDSSMMSSKENYKNHCLERLQSVSYKRKFLQSYEEIYPRHKGASKKDIQNYYRIKKALKNEGVELANELKLYSKNYYTQYNFEDTNLFQLEKKFKMLDENIYILKNADYFLREESKEYVNGLENNLNYLKKIYDTRFNKIEKELLEKTKKNPFLLKEYSRACEYLKVENKVEKLLRASAPPQSENTSFKNERKPRNLYQEIQDKYRNPAKKQEQNNQGQSQESYRGFSR